MAVIATSNGVERICDLNSLCVTNPEATYFVRVTGDSMIGDRIKPGDILVVDCSREISTGKLAVVWYQGEHTVKRLELNSSVTILRSSNPAYEPIYVQAGDDFRIFGMVTFVIQKPQQP